MDNYINNTRILFGKLMYLRSVAVQSIVDYLNSDDYPFPEEHKGQFVGMAEEILRDPESIEELVNE